jgi:hypothetical protein
LLVTSQWKLAGSLTTTPVTPRSPWRRRPADSPCCRAIGSGGRIVGNDGLPASSQRPSQPVWMTVFALEPENMMSVARKCERFMSG